jgi:hypothetical protein
MFLGENGCPLRIASGNNECMAPTPAPVLLIMGPASTW